jgi:hypothetical protein
MQMPVAASAERSAAQSVFCPCLSFLEATYYKDIIRFKAASILCVLPSAIGLVLCRYAHDKLDNYVMDMRMSRFMVRVCEIIQV